MTEEKINCAAGRIVFSEGDIGDAMYVVIKGLIQVYRDTPSGRVVLSKMGAGEFFGEMALIGNTSRTATAVSLTDSTLAVYRAEELEQLLNSRPRVGARMIRHLVERLKETTDRLITEKGRNQSTW